MQPVIKISPAIALRSQTLCHHITIYLHYADQTMCSGVWHSDFITLKAKYPDQSKGAQFFMQGCHSQNGVDMYRG